MSSPEMMGIALGLFCALGIFALKTAVGNYYYLSLPGRGIRKTAVLILMQCAYILLFLLGFELLRHVDFFRVTDSAAFLKNGVLLHLLLCAGLIWWGSRLLVHQDCGHFDRLDSRGWLLLTVPCPVCASAIFLVCAFAMMLFPESAPKLRWILPLVFLFFNLLFLGLLALLGRLSGLRPLVLTGRMMILIALYFILILLIAPHFQEAGKLYAAARSAADEKLLSGSALAVPAVAVCALIAGFLAGRFQAKRS